MSAYKLLYRFFRRSRAANSEVSGGILPKFEHLVKFCPFIRKIWINKQQQIIESIMGRNSVANL